MLERCLADPARPGVDAGTSFLRNLVAFRFFILLHAAVQSWAWAINPLPQQWAFPLLEIYFASGLLTLCAAVSLTRWGWLAPIIAFPVLLWQLYWTFPWTANHTFLVFLTVSLFALLDPERKEDAKLAGYSLRWMAAVLFFYAGLQKVMYGFYFQGEFLSFKLAHDTEVWGALFGVVLPADELARLRGLPGGVGSGPYRVDSIAMLLMSNAVWVAECLLGILLLIPRTRVLAALGAIALVFAIQSAPREFMFALLYSYMLLLWLPGNLNARLLPLYAFGLLYLLAVVAGVAPGEWLLKASGRL